MNTKICTSIEQSKKLLSLGLDPNTADMNYMFFKETLSRCLCRGIIGKTYEEVNEQAIKYCNKNLI